VSLLATPVVEINATISKPGMEYRYLNLKIDHAKLRLDFGSIKD